MCVRVCEDLIKLQSDQRTHLDLRLSLFQAYPSSLDCSPQPLYGLHLIKTSCFQCLTTNTQRLIKDNKGFKQAQVEKTELTFMGEVAGEVSAQTNTEIIKKPQIRSPSGLYLNAPRLRNEAKLSSAAVNH